MEEIREYTIWQREVPIIFPRFLVPVWYRTPQIDFEMVLAIYLGPAVIWLVAC